MGIIATPFAAHAAVPGWSSRDRVAGILRAAGLTQAELAELAGVSRQTVVAVEAGDYAPSVFLALSLARHLGSTVEALFGVEREPLGATPSGGPP